jgi:tRNA pseudouridine38-40 synthase
MCTVVYKLTISYDGTPFSGFQLQKGTKIKTVQSELNQTLSMLFDAPVNVHCAGRTDTGVHALSQVVHFESDREFSFELLQIALNGQLHKSISVKKIEIAPPGFHARFSAKYRSYVYIVDNSPCPTPFLKNRAYWIPKALDIEKMKEACDLLEGHHDFLLFSKFSPDVENTVKTLQTAKVYSGKNLRIADSPITSNIINDIFGIRENLIFFYFRSKSFLHSQVRLMVGNLIEVGKGKMTVDDIRRMLQKDRTVKSSGSKIPGSGLYLAKVEYEDE